MADGEDAQTAQFRVKKGETLFSDGEDSVSVHYLQIRVNAEWSNVFQLTLEGGRSWGDQIDLLYRHIEHPQELLLHVSGYGYWGDTEYYRSLDSGFTWLPTPLRRMPDPVIYIQEILPQV
jgi:hypothetical protein